MRKLKTHSLITTAFIVLATWFTISVPTATALVQFDVNQGRMDPIPVAIQPFTPVNQESREMSEAITNIVIDDLQTSGLFRSISRAAFIDNPSFDTRPNFDNWRKIKANALIVGKVEVIPGEHAVKVMFRIWDTYGEKQFDAMIYKIRYTSWRRLGHKIADKIHYSLVGENGYFDSRIVFVSERGSGKRKTKRLAIMDQDGANLRYLTDGRSLVITPRFDSKNNRVTYMSYHKRTPQVFVINIATGIKSKIGEFQGMSFAPRFSPDGQSMAMSIAKNGSTSIYEVDISSGLSRNMRRLTNDFGTISTSPSYSPDSSQITFSSDRSGRGQLYIMKRSGGEARRISYGGGTYATPVWSPRGDYIAFTKIEGGQFYIGIIKPDGSGERLITSSWLEEGPSWSPNGRAIIFTRQHRGEGSKLCAIDVTGYGERVVKTETDASDPAWSPLLP